MEWTFCQADFYIYRKLVCLRGEWRMKNTRTGQIMPRAFGSVVVDLPLKYFNPLGAFHYPLEDDEIEAQLEDETDTGPWFMREKREKALQTVTLGGWHRMPRYSKYNLTLIKTHTTTLNC
jgi:hypothetical protein